MLFRISIAAVFLVAQLSLSWASGPVMDMDMGADSGHAAAHAAAHSANVVMDDQSHAEPHQDCDCNAECQVSAMTLPSFVLIAAYAATQCHPAFVARALPPGTAAHPYRPPTNS